MWAEFWLALSFLTTLPAPRGVHRPELFARSARWFPVVGLLIGVILYGAHWLLGALWPAALVGGLVTALWAILTGALHLDGLADCCDGLLAPVPAERRLEIMRDPRVGAFGAVGLTLFLVLKATAVASLTQPLALILAPVWARWLLLLAARQPTARAGGMGAAFAAGLTRSTLLAAVIAPLVTLLLAGWRGVAAVAAAHLVAFAALAAAQRRLGGATGDVYGFVAELSELTILLAYAMHAPT